MCFLFRFFDRLFFGERRSRRIERKLDLILERQVILMGKQDDLTAVLNQINDATNKVAAEVADLKLKTGDVVTQAQVDLANGIRDRLTAIAADPADPVPAPAPTPTDPSPT